MKHKILLPICALLLSMASCQKEEDGQRLLTATIEPYETGAKAFIDNDYYTCWESNDQVRINGTSYGITVGGDSHAGLATIDLGENPPTGALTAFYPADMVSTDMTTVTLPQVQNYVERDGHQVIQNPMAARCEAGDTSLPFRNLCALLEVTINAEVDVKAILVKGADSQMLWGKAPLATDNGGNPMLGSCAEGSNTVMLKFDNAVRAAGNKFYIVVPPRTDFGKLTIGLLAATAGDTCLFYSKTSNVNQVLLRNHIGAIGYTPAAGDDDAGFLPNNIIRYTGSVQGFRSGAFDATVVGYGSGAIIFDRPVTKLQNCAFQNCSTLTAIQLPASVTTINRASFENCTSLASISLPESVTTIGDYVFKNCSSLRQISLPPHIAEIESSTFEGCSSLSSINIPVSVTSIGNSAFERCSSLSMLGFPENLVSIGNYSFKNCGLTTIVIPGTVRSIGSYAFTGCSRLRMVRCNANEPPAARPYMFDGCHSSLSIQVPRQSVDAYKSAAGWDGYASKIESW